MRQDGKGSMQEEIIPAPESTNGHLRDGGRSSGGCREIGELSLSRTSIRSLLLVLDLVVNIARTGTDAGTDRRSAGDATAGHQRTDGADTRADRAA
jgi:hypothetical protein